MHYFKNIIICLFFYSLIIFLSCSDKEEPEFPVNEIPGYYDCYVSRWVVVNENNGYTGYHEDRDTTTAIVSKKDGNYEINIEPLNFNKKEDSTISIPKLTVKITSYDFEPIGDLFSAYFTFPKTGEFEHGCWFNERCESYFLRSNDDYMAFNLYLKCVNPENEYFLTFRGIYWFNR
jgi:hypothetical protein